MVLEPHHDPSLIHLDDLTDYRAVERVTEEYPNSVSNHHGRARRVPVGGPRGQRLEVIVRSPEGPAVVHSVPCRFVPLVGEEGFAG